MRSLISSLRSGSRPAVLAQFAGLAGTAVAVGALAAPWWGVLVGSVELVVLGAAAEADRPVAEAGE